MHHIPPRRRRGNQLCGFTLVELLVVVGIIALLIAMLLPALKKAREQAITASCLSNLHQIAVIVEQYSVDTNGWFPSTGRGANYYDGVYVAPTYTNRNRSWCERVVWQRSAKFQVKSWDSHNPVAGRGIFKCPGAAPEYQQGNSGTIYDGYGINRFLSPDIGGGVGFIRRSKIHKDHIMFADGYSRIAIGTNKAYSTSWMNSGSMGVFMRHGGSRVGATGTSVNPLAGANYLFGDGHAEWSNVYYNQGYFSVPNPWGDDVIYSTGVNPGTTSVFTLVKELP
jgi:prepilin-type N-terminal cleavage/methylation domain-containing protein/prepilin-type processing-associated H-X9-DG protein